MTETGPKHLAEPTGTTGPDAAEVVRAEEQVRVDVERVPVRRARLQRYVVTEQRTFTVDVRREEVRLVYEDLSPADGSLDASAEEEMPAVVLREERIELTRTVVPVERVRLVKERVTSTVAMPVDLRTEQVVVEHEV